MKEFIIVIEETLKRAVTVKAENYEDAVLKVTDMYREEEIVLDYDDLEEVDIK